MSLFQKERAAILGDQYLWPGGVVPYVLGSSVSKYCEFLQREKHISFTTVNTGGSL